jgi:hypothetical protein
MIQCDPRLQTFLSHKPTIRWLKTRSLWFGGKPGSSLVLFLVSGKGYKKLNPRGKPESLVFG